MMMMMMMVIIELAIRNFMLLSMHCTHLCVCVLHRIELEIGIFFIYIDNSDENRQVALYTFFS